MSDVRFVNCPVCQHTAPVTSVRCPNPNCNTPRDGNVALQSVDLAPHIPAGEIATRLNALLDELRWFYDEGISIQLEPTPNGWKLKLNL